MRQVKSQIIRTRVNQDWSASRLTAVGISESQVRAANLRIEQFLKVVSRYPVSFNLLSTGPWDGVSVIAVFYKYIQRGRYRRHVLHRIRTNGRVALPLPAKIKAAQEYKPNYSRLLVLRRQLTQTFKGSVVALDVKNVYAVLGGSSRLDLLSLQRYYVFNRYKNLMYLLDLIQVVQISARLGAVPLLGDVISKGLIRNRRKGQRRFIRLIQAVINHARTGAYTQYRPDGWRIELYGKLDGQLRAKRHLLTFGYVSYQDLTEELDYVQRAINTKFGAFGLKLWAHPAELDIANGPFKGQLLTASVKQVVNPIRKLGRSEPKIGKVGNASLLGRQPKPSAIKAPKRVFAYKANNSVNGQTKAATAPVVKTASTKHELYKNALTPINLLHGGQKLLKPLTSRLDPKPVRNNKKYEKSES